MKCEYCSKEMRKESKHNEGMEKHEFTYYVCECGAGATIYENGEGIWKKGD